MTINSQFPCVQISTTTLQLLKLCKEIIQRELQTRQAHDTSLNSVCNVNKWNSIDTTAWWCQTQWWCHECLCTRPQSQHPDTDHRCTTTDHYYTATTTTKSASRHGSSVYYNRSLLHCFNYYKVSIQTRIIVVLQ